jgi:hypothetical protein
MNHGIRDDELRKHDGGWLHSNSSPFLRKIMAPDGQTQKKMIIVILWVALLLGIEQGAGKINAQCR